MSKKLTCSKCGEQKECSAFHKNKARRSGYQHYCKDCMKAHNRTPARKKNKAKAALNWYYKNQDKVLSRKKKARQEDPDKFLNWRLKTRYGITLAEWDVLFEKQSGRCVICQRHSAELDRKLVVDHNHKTGEIRGLLCADCNLALGALRDNPENFLRAVDYLSK